MRDYIKAFISAIAIILLFICVQEYRKWSKGDKVTKIKLEDGTVLKNTNVIVSRSINIKNNTNQKVKIENRKGNINILFDIQAAGKSTSSIELENGFEKILLSDLSAFFKSQKLNDITEMTFIKNSPDVDYNLFTKDDWYVEVNLKKISEERWEINFKIQNAKDGNAKIIKEESEFFPRINPLPGHKIYYSDSQISGNMAMYLLEEMVKILKQKKSEMNVTPIGQGEAA